MIDFDKYKKVLVYGASVSAQSKDDSFWKMLKVSEYNEHFQDHEIGFTYDRLTFPSAFMSDACVLNLDHVLAINPDIVILDWLSTEEQDCDSEKIAYIYNELSARNIKVITLAFVRMDTWDRVTPQYAECLYQTEKYGQSFVDLRVICDRKALGWKDVTRDGVHTSVTGAAVYFETIKNTLNNLYTSGAVRINRDVPYKNNQVIKPSLRISSLNLPREIRVEESNILKIYGFKEAGVVSEIWCQQTVGPYTPNIQLMIEGAYVNNVTLFDEWCKFERFAFKPIIKEIPKELKGDFVVEISLGNQVLDRNLLTEKINSAPYCQGRMLRIHDRFNGINCIIKGYEVV